MILSDREILYGVRDIVYPFDTDRIQPASYEVSLSNKFRTTIDEPAGFIDPLEPGQYTELYEISRGESFWLKPRCFVLGSTEEVVNIPNGLVAEVRGKSSLGRMGLQIHATAGWIDPGYNGTITLEFFNCNSRTILLHPGMIIAQLAFYQLTSPAVRPYGSEGLGSKYQGSSETTEARG